jgi:hypothetical protein
MPTAQRRLDYQGNWRDIFQNWEPLAYSYPEYIESMIATFLNATTADGYNPYRITREGVDWEVPEPDNPWANIGYWSDHQIIYLQKLLEISRAAAPRPAGSISVTAAHFQPRQRAVSHQALYRSAGRSVRTPLISTGTWSTRSNGAGRPRGQRRQTGPARWAGLHVTLAEKLLVLLLAKLVNFVPEGGIWMNTQRPEWNDANNALVGKGLSVVTPRYAEAA